MTRKIPLLALGFGMALASAERSPTATIAMARR